MKAIKSNLSGAIRRTLKEEMEKNDKIFLLGEDIADPLGGIHRVTKGLTNEFGKARVINAPISEIVIAGAGIGAAIAGMRPIIEIMYADFLPICMDQIINNAAKIHFQSGGRINVPLVIRAKYGTGNGEGSQHSQCPIGWINSVPGIKIVIPSSPRDAQGLLKASIEDNNPVIFLEHKSIYPMTGEIYEENEAIPLGKAEIKHEGKDVTIVAVALMLNYAIEAAKQLKEEGIEAEVIDPRTIRPLDEETILESIKKTGRLLTVDEGCFTGSLGSEIVDIAARNAFEYLKCPPRRLALDDTPLIAYASAEKEQLPSVASIVKEVKAMLQEGESKWKN